MKQRTAIGLGLGLAVAALGAACSETLPTEDRAPAPTAPRETYLDARPVSKTCIGKPIPGAGSEHASFQRLTSVKLEGAVGLAVRGTRTYVIERGTTGVYPARILLLSADGASFAVVGDFSSRAHADGGEAGLLGFAFHPKFETNGFVYAFYSAPHPTQPPPAGIVFQSVVSRFVSHDGGLTLDMASEKRLLVVDKPFANHNGGTLAFGNDGFLYWGTGDGGSGGDPQGNGQNRDALLGKMLRIDVDVADGGPPYRIPPTNPFAAGGGRPEIFALGFRNPYRFSIDRVTGDVWVGDVGQSTREEIDKVVLGGNYGWSVREGKTCFAATTCDTTGLVDPVVDHDRNEAVTITGGVVYRGKRLPELAGKYVYADFGTGRFWAIPTDQAAPTPLRLDTDALPRLAPSGFALDADGEILFTSYAEGAVYRVAPKAPPAEMPRKLSQTGCVDPTDATKPAEGLFPYDVIVPQWLDGRTATRFLSVTETDKLIVSPVGEAMGLPPGSVAMRTIASGGKNVETQLLVRRPDASWGAYAYAWDANGTDATLKDDTTCVKCHGELPSTLGLTLAQLDRDFTYGGRTGNVLSTLEKAQMLDGVVDRAHFRPLLGSPESETVERKARAYLHANCSFCHRSNEPVHMNLGIGDPLGATLTCNVPSPSRTSGLAGKLRLAPGRPEESLLATTMRATDGTHMPPVGSTTVDEVGVALVERWIASIGACP